MASSVGALVLPRNQSLSSFEERFACFHHILSFVSVDEVPF